MLAYQSQVYLHFHFFSVVVCIKQLLQSFSAVRKTTATTQAAAPTNLMHRNLDARDVWARVGSLDYSC